MRYWGGLLLLLAIGITAGNVLAAEPTEQELTEKLAAIEKQIAEKPDDPLAHYGKPQLLARLKKYDEAYAAAQVAMEKFKLAKKELAWLMLDMFEVDGHKVSVHFNMGPDERTLPADGIVRPLSFRIYAKDGSRILDRFDYEIGYFGGKAISAAFGQTSAEGHANLGPQKPQAKYSELRTEATKLIKQMVAPGDKTAE